MVFSQLDSFWLSLVNKYTIMYNNVIDIVISICTYLNQNLSSIASASVLITKGSMIAVITSRDNNILTGITVILLFLPPLILSIITTINWKNRRVLVQHPSLILLPVFTFFTFSKQKMKMSCGKNTVTHRIKFSYLYTWINIVISSICFGSIFVISRIMVNNEWQSNSLSYWLLLSSTILFILGIDLTILFMSCSFEIKKDFAVYDAQQGVKCKKWIIPLDIPIS